MWHGVLFACQRRPIVGVLRMCWLLPGSPPPPPQIKLRWWGLRKNGAVGPCPWEFAREFSQHPSIHPPPPKKWAPFATPLNAPGLAWR